MDAHFREYDAATLGMEMTYGQPPQPQLPAVGDYVRGLTAGKRWAGRVITIGSGRVSVNCGGAWIAVDPCDILETTIGGGGDGHGN